MRIPHRWHFRVGLAIILGVVAVAGTVAVIVCNAFHIPHNSLQASAISWGGILLLVATLAWPIFRFLRVRPLAFPRCPHCSMLPPGYTIDDHWPRYRLVCLHCGCAVEAWMGRKFPGPASPSGELPTFLLRRPKFLGIWHQTSASADQERNKSGQ